MQRMIIRYVYKIWKCKICKRQIEAVVGWYLTLNFWSDIDLVSIRAIMQLIVYEAAMILVFISNHELLFWEQAFCEKLEIFDVSLL